MRWIVRAAAAALALAGQAFAQPIDASLLIREPDAHGAEISPNGQFVSVIQRTEDGEALNIFDWRAGTVQTALIAPRERGLSIVWSNWKSDNRLVA
ncbi:MAG: hypothetical protein GC189_07920 [Alphaproteobacteria bacterium]|nr:hypothetical protein [Alphaproteobacteria bacterium]